MVVVDAVQLGECLSAEVRVGEELFVADGHTEELVDLVVGHSPETVVFGLWQL